MDKNIRVYHFFKDFRDDRTEYFIDMKGAVFAAMAYFEGQETTSFSSIFVDDKMVAFRIHCDKNLVKI